MLNSKLVSFVFDNKTLLPKPARKKIRKMKHTVRSRSLLYTNLKTFLLNLILKYFKANLIKLSLQHCWEKIICQQAKPETYQTNYKVSRLLTDLSTIVALIIVCCTYARLPVRFYLPNCHVTN
jgi:hypothetical protein